MHEQLFFDDLKPGMRFESPPKTLRETHYVLFSAITSDAHPIHYSDLYAKEHGLPGPLAHGLLLTAFTALGASPVSHSLGESMIAMVEQSSRFVRPAVSGDTLVTVFEVESVEPRSGDRGAVTLSTKLMNQRDEIVVEGRHTYLVRRSTAAADGTMHAG